MTEDEIREALTRESERVEWKQSAADREGILQATCGLANDFGGSGRRGFLVLGQANDGRVVGIRGDLDEEQQKLVGRLTSSKLFPVPAFHIEVHEIEDKHLLIVCIDPYPVPPVVTVEGTAWVRKGTVTQRAKESDLVRLRERRPEKHQPFDGRLLPGGTVDDLRLSSLREMHLAAREGDHDPGTFPDLTLWLTARDLGRTVQGTWTPNAAAVLLFGESPQSFLPGAVIELVRYGGADVDAPVILRKSVSGTLPDQLEALWTQLTIQVVEVPASSEGIKTPYRPEYPLEALRELARNLVQHRLYEGTNAPGRVEWFDDRVVFSNPGGPFGQAGEGEFGSHADYRNPTITRWLVELGYVEQLGRGIRLVRLLLERNGNQPLDVETDGFTRVTVWRRV